MYKRTEHIIPMKSNCKDLLKGFQIRSPCHPISYSSFFGEVPSNIAKVDAANAIKVRENFDKGNGKCPLFIPQLLPV